MCQLLETIKVEEGRIRNLEYHNRRFNHSREALFGNEPDMDPLVHQDLSRLIPIPDDLGKGIFRCRVLYGRGIQKIEFLPYRSRPVRSMKLLKHDGIDYSLKFSDRKLLESLFAMREECDEILIVKKGFVTDTSVSNVVFRLPDGRWVTPDTPLLNGTMRMHLLETGRISEMTIRPEDFPAFTAVGMINCMTDLDKGNILDMDRIIP